LKIKPRTRALVSAASIAGEVARNRGALSLATWASAVMV